MLEHLHAVVIAGGAGTRFWPLSRRSTPKQLLSIVGDKTLLGATFARVESLISKDRFWLVAGEGHVEGCRKAVPDLLPAHLIAEPLQRNTGPAIVLCALHLLRRSSTAVMAILPADHHVRDVPLFCKSLALAYNAVQQSPNAIATLGITPTRPETGYGYIERGGELSPGVSKVARFFEKPDLERAKDFVKRGNFLWNAGIFVARAQTIVDEFMRQVPAAAPHVLAIASSLGTHTYGQVLAERFPQMPNVSFDYAVMEGAQDVAVVPVDCGWSDVGSFAALSDVLTRDTGGNLTRGRTLTVDAKDCLIWAGPKQVVAAVGVTGLAIIQTPDATLVVPTARAQEVRAVLAELGDLGWEEFL